MSVVLTTDHGPVRVITLNRPEVRNALSRELIGILYEALIAADRDKPRSSVDHSRSGPVALKLLTKPPARLCNESPV